MVSIACQKNGDNKKPGKVSYCSGCVRRDRNERCTAGVTVLQEIDGRTFCGRREIKARFFEKKPQKGLTLKTT